MPEYFHAAYIFGCKRNTAISANKPKYTFLLLTSVCPDVKTYVCVLQIVHHEVKMYVMKSKCRL